MNPELLTLQRMTTGLLYPPQVVQPVQINRLYATITERYPYQSLQHLPDGARMSNPNGDDCFIQLNRVQVNETVVHFRSIQEKCLDIFEIVQANLNLQQFVTFGVKLTAFLPMNEAPQAAQFIEDKMMSSLTRNIHILGQGRQGVGLRVVLHRDAVYELKIEPFFSNLSQIYVELDVQYPTPFTDLSIIEPKMESAYNYMFGEVKEFLGSFE